MAFQNSSPITRPVTAHSRAWLAFGQFLRVPRQMRGHRDCSPVRRMDPFRGYSPVRGRVSRVVLTAGLLAVTATSGMRSAAQTVEPRVIEVTARRFAFEPSLIDVKVGERIRLLVVSADGPHGIEIKNRKFF